MQESQTAFFAGQHVVVRDERWAVVHAEPFATTCLLKLRGIDAGNRDEVLCALTRFDRVRPLAPSTRIRQGSRRLVMARAVRAVADGLRWDQCWTAARARLDLRSWQLEPAVAAVRGTTRILLADSVGLGKTIQAGLIVAELTARNLAERVLVLTPAAIREQWRQELMSRFALSAVVFDQGTLNASAAALPPDVNPWNTTPIIITSIDLVKRPEVRVTLSATVFDVLIIDEAHHLTPGTDRGAVAAELAMRTPWVVLVTATPHSGDDAAFRYLISLGQTDASPLCVFKRARAAHDGAHQRRSRLVYVSPTVAERALLDETRAYARALSQESDRFGARLLGSVIARRAASSAAAAARTLSRRIAVITRQAPTEHQPTLPWLEDDVDDDVPDRMVAGTGLADRGRELEWLHQLSRLAVAAAQESSKLRLIRRLLRRTREPVLIFSEYRDVVTLIAEGISDLCRVAILHGGQSPRERVDAVNAFNSGIVRALVATDAAGEGLNLHARCRLVINLELPWTPLRLEQRIGRVDRIGQTRRVHALHLAHRDSYEGTVVARLERRRQAALLASATPVRAEFCDEALVRRLLAAVAVEDHGPDYAVYAPRAKRGFAPLGATLVFACPALDAGGRVVQQTMVPLQIRLPGTNHVTRRQIRLWLSEPRVADLVRTAVHDRINRLQVMTERTARALDNRLTSLLASPAATAGLWQGSLFDRRSEQRAQQRKCDLETWRAHQIRRRGSYRELGRLRAGEPRLVAAWLSVR